MIDPLLNNKLKLTNLEFIQLRKQGKPFLISINCTQNYIFPVS